MKGTSDTSSLAPLFLTSSIAPCFPSGVPVPEPVWRKTEPHFGKARLAQYVGNLRPGMVVNVTRLTHGEMVAWVETDWGLSRRVFCHHLCFGYEFCTKGGEWIAETDPRALRWLRRVRDELASGKPSRHVGDFGAKLELETVENILRRNR